MHSVPNAAVQKAVFRASAIAGLVLLSSLHVAGCSSPPGDDELISRFNENRDTFERLLQIVHTPSNRGGNIMAEDSSEAALLMRQLGVRSVNVELTYVTFVCSESLPHGSKGYQFRPMIEGKRVPPPGRIVSSLDSDLPANVSYCFREIEEGWFLYLLVPRS